MKSIFAPAQEAFKGARDRWDELNAARGNHILLDSLFVDSALRHFGDENVLLGVKNDSRHSGLAMFKKKGLGSWETFQPSQAPIGFVLLPKHIDVQAEISAIMRSLPGYALQLSLLQQDPNYAMAPYAIESRRFETVDYIVTARIPMVETFEDYWKTRSTNLRHNISRRRRRMAEKGLVPELVTLTSAQDALDALKAYANLESKGWKAQLGTAVTLENTQGQFYQDIFQQFLSRGEAAIYQLRVNGEVIATDLCLLRNETLIVLKTTYDEAWKDYSPAILMREEIMKQLFAEKRVRLIEFYGRAMDWHRQWTDEIRTMYHVNCFRNEWVRSLKEYRERVRAKTPSQDKPETPQQPSAPIPAFSPAKPVDPK